ncbi:Gfo/Idh/MocA family protein [Zunongwangia atlantica]|uniref:Dehydrogenase n=1 Tax=Zunongwangia atlantica 22II14-10F7 TaxID=1185767 RepID=A0A1Y1T619_9FLAO|nr:Gfo/Idh/MocA family oxidoreductase [Zunongwangia atlantica]ORL46152.1 dehydrogenase [Zunongwangia atlantica 22II14-10F7]|tara:strand:- start:15613 stop:16953 length:1341 start_codon:yes stop_codon:yes gene_type:complete
MSSRRKFLKNTALGGTALAFSSSLMGMPAKSYNRIIGSNDRLNVAIAGLGRRLAAFYNPIALKESNVHLSYLCDVMESQRAKALNNFSERIAYKPKLEVDIRKIIEDKDIDVLFNLTPDHWHTPGSIMALKAGKHVYVEKPCSHNMNENELLVQAANKYDKLVQMGNQQRSSGHTIDIINQIHNGVIGKPYKAVAFYVNSRDAVPVQKRAAVPQGLDWELWQGPAVHREYTSETWNYNWHWYGWNYGTGEAGNNATHELDVARWALQVEYPEYTKVLAHKRQFKDDGWEMYDSMEATFSFPDDKVIQWDGKSRNGYNTYGAGRGTIIYGSNGAAFVDRERYEITDLNGKIIKEFKSGSNESGTALGGGGDTSTAHVLNFFNSIRGKDKLQAPIADAAVSMAMVHYANIAYRTGNEFEINSKTGHIYDRKAMKLWDRKYEKGWEPSF